MSRYHTAHLLIKAAPRGVPAQTHKGLDVLAGSPKWEMTQEYKGSDGGAYRDYHLNNNPRDGILTVELDMENGYRIRNVFVDESLQRKGTATLAYEMLNRESIKNTGKPLRSSEVGHARKSGPTSETPEAVALWESLVQKGEAERVGDHYQFIPPQAAPPKAGRIATEDISPKNKANYLNDPLHCPYIPVSRYHIAHLLIEAVGKKRVKDLVSKHGLSEDEIRAMAEFDPTDTDKFLGWIAKQVAAGELSIPGDGPEMKKLLEDFGRKGKLTGEPDINKWTFSGLLAAMSTTESKGEAERSKVEKGQKVFFDEPPWKVIKITKFEAADKLLRPEWCIKDRKYWKQYGCSARRPAYLVLKNGKKYACMVPHKGELKGTDDEPLRSIKMFAKLLRKLAPQMRIIWTSDFLELEHLARPIEEIAADPESAYRHARFVIGGRWPEGETAIAAEPEWACRYAEDVVKGRWPAGEATIAASKWALDYAFRVVRGPWPEGEAEIASRGVQYELEMYGDLVCDPNWADKYGKAASRVGRYHIAYLLIAGDDEYEPWSFPWIRPEEAAWGLAEYGEDDDIIHDLVSSEGRELAETFDSLPDPMEIWRTLSLPSGGLKEDSIGIYWSWSKAGAIAHIAVDGLTGNVSLLHGEVEKRNVNWPSTFAANMSSYQEEAEIYLNAGTPVRLLDIDGETDGRTLTATRTGSATVSRYHIAHLLIEGASKSTALKPNYLDIGHDDNFILWQYEMSTGLKTVTQDELMAEHEFTGADEFHDITKDTVARGRIDFDSSIGSIIFEDVPEKWQKKAIEALMAEAFPVRFVVFSDKSLLSQMSLSKYWQTLV